MAPRVALSDGFLLPRAFLGAEMRRELHPSADRRCCSWVACVAKSRSGMFLRPPDQCRSLQRSKFYEAEQSHRRRPVVVSMCKDEAEITAAQELADGSIFFSFGDKPVAQNSKDVEEMSLSPREHILVACVDLPNRWPSQFKRQFPYPVIGGIQGSPESLSFQKDTKSNHSYSVESLNKSEFGSAGKARHTPSRFPSKFIKKSPISLTGVGNLAESPSQVIKMLSRSTDETESGKKGYTPIRLPSKFVRKSPISSSPVLSVAEMKARAGNKYPETANQENPRKPGYIPLRLLSNFVKQSPIPASLVGPPAALPLNKSYASRSRSNKSTTVILEDLKSMHGAKEMDSIQSKSHSQTVISGKGIDWQLDSNTHNQDGSPTKVVMADSKIGLELEAGGSKKDDHLISKAKLNTRRGDENIYHVLDEVIQSNSSVKTSIPPQVDHHAPTRLPSNFVRISPIPSAVGQQKVQQLNYNNVSETGGRHRPPQPVPCSLESQQSHAGTSKDSAKVAFLKSSKTNKKTLMHEDGKGKTTKDIPKVEEIKFGCSSSSTTRSSSDNHKSHYDYSQYTVPELKMLAKSLNLKGYSKLRRQELLELLQSAERTTLAGSMEGWSSAVALPREKSSAYSD